MNKFSKSSGGFTIAEVLVSVGIMVILLPYAASMLTNSKLLASYSKHKIQAAYAAQQLIESQRQIISTYFTSPIGPLTTCTPPYTVQPSPASVLLDTKGNYTNTNCATNTNLFCGTALITVCPAVYTSTSGAKTTSTLVDHFVVTISWNEQIGKTKIPMTEYYAEDIANDPMLN